MAKNEDLKAVANSMDDFTINFHESLAQKNDENFVSSAFSAHVGLSMAASGAEDTTASEMRQVLKYKNHDKDTLHLGFQSLIDDLNNMSDVTLEVANKIYISKKLSIKDGFQEITSKYFRSESETIDFSNRTEAVSKINEWCAEKTKNKIKEIIDENACDESKGLILLNAIYFKGGWKDEFNGRTTNKPFHVNKTITIEVPTMYTREHFFFKRLPDLNAVCVALPYKNKNLHMLIIVPNEIDGLEIIEKNLDKIKFVNQELSKSSILIDLYLPKFMIESKIDLNQHLKKLGMKEMFSDKANFNGISEEDIKVDKVVQKAFIKVNEEGSEAAAVTEVEIMLCSLEFPTEFKVDKPFYYSIFHSSHGITLFSGHVTRPTYIE